MLTLLPAQKYFLHLLKITRLRISRSGGLASIQSALVSLRLDVGTADRTKPPSHNETIAQPLYTSSSPFKMKTKSIILFLLLVNSLACFSQEKVKKYDLQADLSSSLECWDLFIFFPESDYSVAINREDIGLSKNSKLCHKIRTNSKINQLIVDVLKRNLINDGYEFTENEYVNFDTGKPIKYELIKMFVNFSFIDPCHNSDVVILFTDVNKASKFINDLSNIFKEKECFKKLNRTLKIKKN